MFSKQLFKFFTLLVLLGTALPGWGQTTVTINATGVTGGFQTGSVNAAGTKNDGNMIDITSSTNRGFAVFDLSNLPQGALVSSASLIFTTYTSTSSSAVNTLTGYTFTTATDPATLAGATLYTQLGSASTLASGSWTANAANTLTVNAAGRTLIGNSATGKLVVGYIRASTNQYNIYGYPGTATQQPQLSITYTVPAACSGTPNAGTAFASTMNACSANSFTLTDTAYTIATGLSYQWQSAPAGSTTFTNIAGATGPTYTVTSQTAATDYRFTITCANSGVTGNSNTVAVGQNSFLNCYCASAATSTADEEILNVTVGTLNNSSTCTTTAPGTGSILNRYSNYAGGTGAPAAPNLATGTPVSFSISVGSCGTSTYNSGTAIFIDWNQNGVFTDAGEMVANNGTTTQAFPYTFTGTISVPSGATLGNTRMRVINAESAAGASITPCLSYGFGETEDYLVNVTAGMNCAGTPAAGTASSTVTTTCSNTSFTLSATGLTTGLGITYQWQSAPAGSTTFTNIAGATGANYVVTNQTAATDYRIVTTCANSNGTNNSNTVAVGQNVPTACYCTPTYTNGGGTDNITNVTLGTLNDTPPANASPYYFNRVSAQNAIPTVNTGVSALLSVTMGTDGTQYNGVWFDWDQDGIFAAAEFYTSNTNPGSSGTAAIQIAVPSTATLGTTRMRIRAGDDSQPSSTQACGASNSTYGQALDYAVSVAVGLPCAGTPTGGTVAPVLSNVCPGTINTLTATGYTIGTLGLSYQWESSATANGSFTAIAGANGTSYTTPGYTSGSTFYRFTVTCTNSGLSGSSNAAEISGPIAPTTQVSNVAATTSSSTSTTISWTNGNGNRRVAYISTNPSFTAPVTPNSPGTAVAAYNTVGQQLVYDGTGNSVTVTGLIAGTTYYVTVLGVQFCSTTSEYYYNTTTGAGNVVTLTTPNPPVNDECSGAIAISATNGFSSAPTTGFFAGATPAATTTVPSGATCGSPDPSGAPNDVWYTTTVPATGNLIVEMNATGGTTAGQNDYILQAYSGTCGALTYVSCVDDGSLPQVAPNNFMPRLALTSQTAGATIYLRVVRTVGTNVDTFLISAYDTSTSVRPAVATGGICAPANTVTIDAASKNLFKWVPIFDGSNNIVAEVFANGNSLGEINTDVNVNSSGTIRTTAQGRAYADRNFTITPTTQPAANATVQVRLYMKQAEVTALRAATPGLGATSSIRVTKNGNTCGDLVPAPSLVYTSTVANYGSDTAFAITIPSFSSFYLSGGTAPLPVNLTAISARAIGKANRIDWTSASEEAAAAFVVERSTNGVEFTAIGKVAAQGKSAAYTFTDETPAAGISYYRLQMLDVNGESNYSRTVTATQGRSNTVAMSAYPNPATDRITVEVAGATEGSTITLKDLSGKTLAQQTLVGNSAVFSVANLPAGLYFAVYTGGNATQVIKITKQ